MRQQQTMEHIVPKRHSTTHPKKQLQKYPQRDSQEQIWYDQNNPPTNCPLICKTIIVSLITIGILAFIVLMHTQVINPIDLYESDFTNCSLNDPNVKRLRKNLPYQTMVQGLSIAALVLCFGLSVYLLILSYNYCRIFDDCCGQADGSQSSQKDQSQSQSDDNNHKNKKNKKQRQNNHSQQKARNQSKSYLAQFIKSKKHIKQVQQKYDYDRYNSQNCECDSLGECLGYFFGFLWCRTCFQAHYFHFYRTKTQQYTYWIIYLFKTLFFGYALAYVIRLYISLDTLGLCRSFNATQYSNGLYMVMIVGIVTACVDVFGYIHLFIEGSILEIVENTLNQKRKSQNSQKSSQQNSENQSSNSQSTQLQNSEKHHKKSRQNKYKQSKIKAKSRIRQSEQLSSNNLKKQFKSKSKLANSRGIGKKQQNKDSQKESHEIVLKKKPVQQNEGPKQTDSFFISLRTIGKRFMDNMGEQSQSQSQKQAKHKTIEQQSSSKQISSEQKVNKNSKLLGSSYKKALPKQSNKDKQKKRKQSSSSSEQEQQSSSKQSSQIKYKYKSKNVGSQNNKKPQIKIQQNVQRMLKRQSLPNQIELQKKDTYINQFYQNDKQVDDKKIQNLAKEQKQIVLQPQQHKQAPIYQKPSTTSKFGAFNRNNFSRPTTQNQKANPSFMQNLSKFSTRIP